MERGRKRDRDKEDYRFYPCWFYTAHILVNTCYREIKIYTDREIKRDRDIEGGRKRDRDKEDYMFYRPYYTTLIYLLILVIGR